MNSKKGRLSRAKKILLVTAGSLLLVLAALGMVLPVLPTTPFVLLAALCFSSSSDRMYNLVLQNRYFGSYIENYRTKQGVPKSVKIRSIIVLWALLILSGILVDQLWIRLLLVAVGVGVTTHLLLLKTKIE